MAETQHWVWIGVGIIAVIALVVSIGNYIHDRISPKAEEYQRAQEALATYEDQQRKHAEHEARAARQMDRQEALLDRIERLLDRWESRFQAEQNTPPDRGRDSGFRAL